MIKILIADDHPLVRDGIRLHIDQLHGFIVVGEANDGGEALRLLVATEVDIVILDISMPGENGIEILKQIKSVYPHIKVLMLSMYAEKYYAIRALKNGASGYLTKTKASRELQRALIRISEGHKYVSESMAEEMLDLMGPKPKEHCYESLSDRELQILVLIAEGKSLSRISSDLSLSVKTVGTYRSRLLAKMNMTSNAELIRYAILNDLVQ